MFITEDDEGEGLLLQKLI